MEPTTINLTASSSPTQDILSLVAMITLGVTVLVHLIVAIGILNDSMEIQRRGARLMFFGALTWAFVGLMTGVFGLLAYWFMHHSSFRAASSSPATVGEHKECAERVT